jgi:hypothetical protein
MEHNPTGLNDISQLFDNTWKTSTGGRSDYLYSKIGDTLISVLVKESSNRTSVQEASSTSIININCDPNGNCNNCIKNNGNDSAVKICKKLCNCSLNNSTLNNNLDAQLLTIQISKTADPTSIANQVFLEMQKDYDNMAPKPRDGDFQKVVNFITTVQDNLDQETVEIISSNQLLDINGPFNSVEDINLSLDAKISMKILQAIDATLSDDNNMQTVVQQQMEEVRKNIDKDFNDTFKQVWDTCKNYVIGMIITIIILVFILTGLLFYRASKSK